MTEIAVGASTWASGSQVWNGKIGHLDREADEEPERDRRIRTSNPVSQASWVPCAM